MAKQFNSAAFKASFIESIDALLQSEQVTKRELQALSRTTLEALHEGDEGVKGDIAYINRLIGVLTPVNKKVARLFFREFSGFKFDEVTNTFTVKNKKTYADAANKAMEFMADPHQNIWTWAERNVEVEKKDFDLEQVKKAFAGWVKKAQKENLTQKDVLRAIFSEGVELETIVDIMQDAYNVDPEESKIVINA